MGFETPITIEKLMQGIQENRYVLPAIQREFVWNDEQIQKLFDSLLRGYPIGSFLFWKIDPARIRDFQFYCFMDHYHERDDFRNEPIDPIGSNGVTAVLDGQQRLTALNIGLNGWYANKLPYYRWNHPEAFPKRRLYLNLRSPDEDMEYAYEFRMLREKDAEVRNKKVYWFLVNDILKFPDMQSVFYYCVQNGLTDDGNTYPSTALMELWRVVKEKPLINFFMEEAQDLDKVLNIFIRVNSGGTILSYSDMLLSIATADWQKIDAREAIYGLVDELNQVGDRFSFNKDFILKSCLVLSDIPTIEFRVTNFTRDNMAKIEANWTKIAQALRITTYLLASWGYNWQTMVSNYAAIPLAYYIFKRDNPEQIVEHPKFESDRDRMRKWFKLALLKRTFGGTSDFVLRSVRRAIQEHFTQFPMDEILDELKTSAKAMHFDTAEVDGLLAYRYGQGYTFTVLSLVYPWLRYNQKFNLDHIFPRGMFNEKELSKRDIPRNQWYLWLDHVNDLANLQLLQTTDNILKSDQDFEKWLNNECPSPQDLASYRELHLIPDVSLKFEDFPQFLEAREKILRKRLAEYYDVHLTNNGN